MPGLLQSSGGGVASVKFVAAFFAELIGVLIFTLYGSAVPSNYGPWGNGITLAVLGRSTFRIWLSVNKGRLQLVSGTSDSLAAALLCRSVPDGKRFWWTSKPSCDYSNHGQVRC